MSAEPAAPGLYLHVPFCSSICPYCDFSVVHTASPGRERFASRLAAEVELAAPEWRDPRPFDTVYLGGGTPSQLRHDELSRVLDAHVVNAGDGAHEHPTQALLDTLTIREKKGRIAGLKVTILGDILFSRVARSDIWALTKLGAEVTLCGPSTLVPRAFEQFGCRVTHDMDEAIRDADVINLLRIQHERQRKAMFPSINEYTQLFGLNKARLAKTKPDALIMHPGPVNRGVEIDSEIADSTQSLILEQVTNGIAVRMAALFLVNGGKGPGEIAAG